MVRFCSFIAFWMVVSSCAGPSGRDESGEVAADSLIPAEKMSLVLADVHVVEAAYLLGRNGESNLKGTPAAYYDSLFRKHHISRERYDQTLEYYRLNPDKFRKLYAKVAKILEERQKNFPPKK